MNTPKFCMVSYLRGKKLREAREQRRTEHRHLVFTRKGSRQPENAPEIERARDPP